MKWRAVLFLVLAMVCAASFVGCPANPAPVRVHGQTKLTILHTADIHSRLFPYELEISQTDAALGLGVAGTVATVGGVARVAYILDRERARSDRVLHIDGGDTFQGAPVFNFFRGEPEVRAMSAMGTDVQVIANHEFDDGALNVRIQHEKWGDFPLLAANYKIEDPDSVGNPELHNLLKPFAVFNVRGLRVGVIGMGNLSSLASLFQRPSRLGVTPLNTIDTAQAYVDLLRPLVDLIVVDSHLGLNADLAMIKGTTGIDIVLGSHNHIVLQPPKVLDDCAKVDKQGRHYIQTTDAYGNPGPRRYCNPRPVLEVHSGAYAKYVGRLDIIASDNPKDMGILPCKQAKTNGRCYDPVNGFEIVSHQYKLIPVTDNVPQDRAVAEMLEPYKQHLDELVDLDLLVGYAPDGSKRFGTSGGDSPLGNMIATGMWRRLGIQSDFALTNTTGIRADMVPGPVTIAEMFDIFPFDNSITKMQLSGTEVQEMFDFVARRSAGRGCVSQAQIAGARVVLDCNGCSTVKSTPQCKTDTECPSHNCNQVTGHCVPQPCAEHIYIGASDKPCSTDLDCGKNMQNSCDMDNPDKNKQGRCLLPITPTGSYEFATSNYLAGGGSGFTVLKRNTTQHDSHIQQRDALIDWIRAGHPCGYTAPKDQKASASYDKSGLLKCGTDKGCVSVLGSGYVCACPEDAAESPDGTCSSNGSCSDGRCVLAQCRQDVANYHRQRCQNPSTAKDLATCTTHKSACEIGGEECKFLACINHDRGNFSDNRVMMVGR